MSLVTQNLNQEFHRARNQEAVLGSLQNAAGQYSYLTPNHVREPATVAGPRSVRVGHGIANLGSHSMDSSYLSTVEKRAISRSASSITYAEPEIKC